MEQKPQTIERAAAPDRAAGQKEIWLAGGCFWGTEEYLRGLNGIVHTSVGYANGRTEQPSYEEVCKLNTGHAETVHVVYNAMVLPLPFLLSLYFQSIDPVSLNQQGNDVGVQYRTGIYYSDKADLPEIEQALRELTAEINQEAVIEVAPIENYYLADSYHQAYLQKNPSGYCHIPRTLMQKAREAKPAPLAHKEDLRRQLNDLQYRVTQENFTEPPFENPYWDFFEPGLYVDVTTGEPLFLSTAKFKCSCGWPAFSRPVRAEALRELPDLSHGMRRVEVRSSKGDAHLGHVFPDGPREQGGLRYCINSAALRFIPQDEMAAAGYGELLPLLQK